MFLTAEFADTQSVAQAIAALKSQGVTGEQLDVFSTEPVEIPGGLLDRPSHMSLTAVASAASFCLLAFLFVRYAQYNYPVACRSFRGGPTVSSSTSSLCSGRLRPRLSCFW